MSPERILTEIDGRELSLSNLDKVWYPDTGFMKSQVLDYYARVADVMLPHLAGRPTTFRRYPNGVEGTSFYEKHAPANQPEWIKTIEVPSKRGEHELIIYTAVANRPTLLWAANLAAISTPLVIGYILQATGSFYWALNFMGIVCLIGTFSYSVLLGRLHRIEM